MYILQKISDATKFVQTYHTETGAFVETYEGALPVAFKTQEEALAVQKLINDANDPSNHVSAKLAASGSVEKETPQKPALGMEKKAAPKSATKKK